MKAILSTSAGTHYNDLPEEQYHFPGTYLNQVRQSLGDWIIYYEPRRDAGHSSSGGRQAYFAVAQIKAILDDPNKPGHYYAKIGNYLEFDHPVPFREGVYYYESLLKKADGSTNKGAFGRAVRKLPDKEFELILKAGFARELAPWERQDEAVTEEHPVIEQLTRRKFRDSAFRKRVRNAYNNTCAVTGLCLINGGGRPEVEAAHIRPVSDDGPDSVRNGLALTGTVHWLFDRGLISIDDDYRLLISSKAKDEKLNGLLRPEQIVHLPSDPESRPNPGYIRWHRENRFAG